MVVYLVSIPHLEIHCAVIVLNFNVLINVLNLCFFSLFLIPIFVYATSPSKFCNFIENLFTYYSVGVNRFANNSVQTPLVSFEPQLDYSLFSV